MMFKLVITLEDWWCHRLKLPGARRFCDRYDAWVLRSGESD